MKTALLGFRFALGYFTSIPAFLKPEHDMQQPGVLRSLVYSLPLVGLILALCTLLIWQILEPLGVTGAIMTAVLSMMLYGFLHTEAILDVMDAIYAKHSGKDAYEIIKESTVGAIGVLYAVGFVIMKVAVLTSMLLEGLYIELIAVFMISRLCSSLLIAHCTFRSSFLDALKKDFKSKDAATLFIILAIAITLFTTLTGLLILIISVALSWFFKARFEKSLGFLNGDTLGYNLELIEIIAMTLFLLLV